MHVVEAELALESYETWPKTPCGFEFVDVIESGDLFAFVAESADKFCVAIRGSDSFRDFAEFNFNLDTEFVTGVGVHAGFVAMARDLQAEMLKRKHKPKEGQKVVYVGHSLGGGVAIASGLIRQVDEVVVFGCPRALRTETAWMYPSSTTVSRYVDWLDLIPEAPFQGTFLTKRIKRRLTGWSHIGNIYYLLKGKVYRGELSLGQRVGRRLRQAWSFATNPVGVIRRNWTWHKMRRYYENIRAISPAS